MTHSKSNRMKELTPTRTAQHCAQCTAHGKISLLKGHKKVCPFKDCTCVHCVLVINKRQIMAKQVKLKRLQEKNHARQRRGKGRNTSLCETMTTLEKNTEMYQNGTEIPDLHQYQEEAWQAICGQDLSNQAFEDQVSTKYLAGTDQRLPISPLQYSHQGPLQQLQNQSVILQPYYPVSSSTTFPFYQEDYQEVLPINHVMSQPVYYQYLQPGQNFVQINHSSNFTNGESYLQPLEVVPITGFGNPQSIDAAETLLTLHTGEDEA